ncbi:MAG: hypothetical protein EHM45_01975 [Desulfobacteraceae bacterium]|nr:MAG: hypothetical protein EHM45_01975 [Desulfobacteraceae bacterium]
MKLTRFLCLAFLVCAFMAVVYTGDTSSQTTQPGTSQYKCTKDSSGNPVCERKTPPEMIYTNAPDKAGKTCKWRCRMEQGVEVCRGSGPECNGKIPPHWQSQQ